MKKALKPVELFLTAGLSAAIATSGGVLAFESQEETEVNLPTVEAADLLSQGGEGGEGGDAGFTDKLTGTALVSELRKGGYVIFFRHAQTEKDYADQADPQLDLGDCSTQRSLSEAGWQDARLIGESFADLNIPVGKVYASQYCRAWQTADLAFGEYEKVPGLNFAKAEEYTDAQVAQMRAGIMPFLTATPTAGTNTVVVGHDDVFESASGIYPEPQGIAFILKPDGNGEFEIIANLVPKEWAVLGQ
ncbi:MAG: histidine phosphatase family protein [Microcoleaceae cyanobacterium]